METYAWSGAGRRCCAPDVRWLLENSQDVSWLTCSSYRVPTGDGVNNALHDSAELAKLIIQHGVDDLDSAVVEYEKALLPRTMAQVEKGVWYTTHFFGADTPEDFLQAAGAQ